MSDKFDVAVDSEMASLEAPAIQLRSQKKRLFQTFARNRPAILGVFLMLLVLCTAFFADDWFIAIPQGREPQPLLAPYDPLEQDAANRLAPPSREHLMGLDSFGRDTLSRVIYGSRVSLMVGVIAVLIGGVTGAFMGLMGGYLGGKTENVVMRFADVLMAFPSLIMGLMVLAVLGGGLSNMILAIGIVLAPTFARVAHSSTLSVKGNEYVTAARSVGAGSLRITRLHILPNILSEVVVLGRSSVKEGLARLLGSVRGVLQLFALGGRGLERSDVMLQLLEFGLAHVLACLCLPRHLVQLGLELLHAFL